MTRIQQSLTIEAPLEEVAAYTSDPTHLPEWNKIIVRVWDVQATPEVLGTTWKLLVRVMGAEHHVAARIHLYDPPGRFGVELLGGVAGMPGLTASLEIGIRPARGPLAVSASSSTQVTCTLSIHFPLLMGGAALGAVVSPIISDQLRHGLMELKRLLEARRRTPPSLLSD